MGLGLAEAALVARAVGPLLRGLLQLRLPERGAEVEGVLALRSRPATRSVPRPGRCPRLAYPGRHPRRAPVFRLCPVLQLLGLVLRRLPEAV